MTRFVVGEGRDAVWLDHEGIERETEKAVCFSVHGESRWIPKSVIVDYGDDVVGVQQWFADKNGWKGDW